MRGAQGRVPSFDEVILDPRGPVTFVKDIGPQHGHPRTAVGKPSRRASLSWAEKCAPAVCPTGSACTKSPARVGLSTCRRAQNGTWNGHMQIRKSCEPHAMDQSVLNWHFAGRWHRLPKSFNVQSKLYATLVHRNLIAPAGPAHVALVHFVGDVKPWDILSPPQPRGVLHRTNGSLHAGASLGTERTARMLFDLWRMRTAGMCQELTTHAKSSRARKTTAIIATTRRQGRAANSKQRPRDVCLLNHTAYTESAREPEDLRCCPSSNLEPGRSGRCSWQASLGKCKGADAGARSMREACPVACLMCKVCLGHPQFDHFAILACRRGHEKQREYSRDDTINKDRAGRT